MSEINEILDFLKECSMFFMATSDGASPRVRPMGLVFPYKNKLMFGTSNKKDLWKQLQDKPEIEICACLDHKWLRLRGKVGFEKDRDAKVAALEVNPGLKRMYNPDDGVFEVFYFESATGAFEDMSGAPKREIKL
jgi:uncharacterized pyridoxamine 5'-phosphate oxidase family protein